MFIKLRLAALIGLLAIFSALSFADEVRDTLFSEADDALRAANAASANILAPESYEDATNAYRSAEQRLEKGQGLDRIRKDLDKALIYLRRSIETARIAEVTLTRSIAARADAVKAQADKYATEEWQDAESTFNSAASRLESGNIKSAQRKADDAEAEYRKAELIAIKANYLTGTRNLIEIAKDNKAEKYAPQTLSKAESLLAQAEQALNDNRYDIDQPRALAREAKYEAQHANHIALIVEPAARKKVSIESLVLELEKPVIKIASSLELVAAMDGSIEDVSLPIREKIALLQKDSYELVQRRQQIAGIEGEMAQLESRLGVQSQRLQNQEKRRQQIETIERIFNAKEAVVLTQANKVIIRMVGLNFKSGRASIDTENFSLLRKVQRALNVFPTSMVAIEGHTDSFGSDQANLTLSQQRAEAVREYLLANMTDRLGVSITAQGYGETQPIGNNETAEGRTRNRRIDLAIQL